MMLRIQRERLAGLALDLAEYIARYQLSEERLAACAPELLVMHPGPMIRGLEIAGEVADGAAVGDRGAGDAGACGAAGAAGAGARGDEL